MKNFYSILENKIGNALDKLNYKVDCVVVNESSRPDLGEYQYNGVMQLAKIYHKSPIEIAKELIEILKNDDFFKNVYTPRKPNKTLPISLADCMYF